MEIIHSEIISRRPPRQGVSEEPAEQPGSAVSRHRSEQRGLVRWIGLRSPGIGNERAEGSQPSHKLENG